jgi:hypothetical protein
MASAMGEEDEVSGSRADSGSALRADEVSPNLPL